MADIKYYDIQKFAWETPVKPAGRKLVFLCLAFHSDNFGSSFPSIATIADETDQGESTVKDHLKQLVNDGLITRKRQRYENGYLAGYRYYVQLSDLGLGPDYTHSYVQSSDDNKDQLKTNNINTTQARPMWIDWKPDDVSIQRCREANFTNQEFEDCVLDFIEYWMTQSNKRNGKKKPDGWQRAFRHNVGATEKRHGTRYRKNGNGKSNYTNTAQQRAEKKSADLDEAFNLALQSPLLR